MELSSPGQIAASDDRRAGEVVGPDMTAGHAEETSEGFPDAVDPDETADDGVVRVSIGGRHGVE